MANEKKIAKNQKLFLSWLEHVIEVENQLQNAEDNKKIEKLQKKLKKNKDMVVYNGKLIGQEGGTIQSIWGQLTERQQQIVQELFPYGLAAEKS